jgi:hypothetical protein
MTEAKGDSGLSDEDDSESSYGFRPKSRCTHEIWRGNDRAHERIQLGRVL